MNTAPNQVLLRCTLAAVLVASPITAAFAQQQGNNGQGEREARASAAALSVPISGTVAAEATPQATSPLTGTFTIQRFARSGNGIVAVGTLTASFTDPLTDAPRTLVTQASLPLDRGASGAQASAADAAEATDEVPLHGPAAVALQPACDILNLVLGPLDLNLLGLRIQLNQVVLDITAVPGAGNLLGNLLCAVAGLLDGPGPLARLVALLNQLLAILG